MFGCFVIAICSAVAGVGVGYGFRGYISREKNTAGAAIKAKL